jgi:hypothetical protein
MEGQSAERFTNWRQHLRYNTEPTPPPDYTFRSRNDGNVESLPLYNIANDTPPIPTRMNNFRVNTTRDVMNDDYQRRYQVERNTRSILQRVFDIFENSSLFSWIRDLEGRFSRPREHGYYQSRRNYNQYNYGMNPYSRHEAFIENVVDKWISFRDTVGSEKSEEEKMSQDKLTARDFGDMNQSRRYFSRDQIPEPTYWDQIYAWIWKILGHRYGKIGFGLMMMFIGMKLLV